MMHELQTYIRTSALIRTLEGTAVAHGILEGLTGEEVTMAVTSTLHPGTTYRFLLINELDPSSRLELLGDVLWTRDTFNVHEELNAECRVRWVTVEEPEDAATSETSAAGPEQMPA